MTSNTSVIVQAGVGGLPLLRTADSIVHQRRRPADVWLVEAAPHGSTPLAESVAARLRASLVPAGAKPGVSMNRAVRGTASAHLIVIPAGITLDDAFIDRCESIFADQPSAAAIAPMVALRTPDGCGELHWLPDRLSVAGILSDARSTPPAFAIRRRVLDSVGGFDETLDGLVEYELWLRMALAGHAPVTLHERLLFRDVTERSSRDPESDRRHLELFRGVMQQYAGTIAHELIEVIVAREIRFGQLREAHRALIARRDAGLEELDRLRAEAAHHRAYLAHHGVAEIAWGDLRRVDPVSREWGYDRGEPVDRRYIDEFLASHSSDVSGAVLEVQEDDFSRAYGGARVTEYSVLDIDAGNRRATVLADLRHCPDIPADRFDCVILTQTLHVIDDMAAALGECYRILKPGGVLLATVPAASRVCLEYGEEGDFWRATPAGARALFRFAFTPAHLSTTSFGNILTNTAFLHGLAASEITEPEFAASDPYFPALTGIRARKTDAPGRAAPRGVVLLYHRVDDQADVHELGVPASLLLQHLQWLKAECSLMPLDDLLGTPPEALPRRPVAITFDDGYVDNLEMAAPLLQEHGIPASFFLTSRWLDEPGEYWWDMLERVLLGERETPPTLTIRLADRDETLGTADGHGRREAHWRLHEVMVHASLDERDRLEAHVRTWSGGGRPRVRPMIADEVRRLAAYPGVSIGAHTVKHLALRDQSEHARGVEIAQSRADLARIVGQPIDLFAYPYGAVDRGSAAAIRQSCRWGVSCDELPLAESFDAARVPRLDVKRWDIAELASRIERLFQPPARSAPRALTLKP